MKKSDSESRASHSAKGAVVIALISIMLLTGCYTKYYAVGGDTFPAPATFPKSLDTAGVIENENSVTPQAASVSASSVVEKFAKRLQQEEVFSQVVFPYSEMAHIEPSLILDATVRIEEKLYMGENIAKAFLTGLSLFLLAPVLPTRFGFAVDLSVDATELDGELLGTYSYTSEYELKYTTLMPTEEKMTEWLDKTVDHAIEEVVNQIKEDHSRLRQVNNQPRRASLMVNRPL